jgi:D-psicose/D-tagatose/L-ribulose 3-epimerase
MKFGVHAYVWRERWSDSSVGLLDRARELGLDALEISNGDDIHFTPRLTRRRAEALGMDVILSPGGLWPMECDISLANRAHRRRGVAWHRRSLDLAAETGAVAYVGAIYGHPGHVPRRRPTADEYRWMAENLHVLAEHAARRNVRLVLEPMSHFRTHLVNRPAQLVRVIRMSDHPNLYVLLDTYHLITEVRDYADAVKTAWSRLWGIHACESDRGIPGGGLVPWPTLARALKERGFDGYVGMESYNHSFAAKRGLFHDPCPDGDVFVRRGLAFLRRLLGGGERR